MKTFYTDGRVRLYCADVLPWAIWHKKEVDARRAKLFHSIITDCPYGLSDPPPIEKVLTAWLAGDDFDYKKKGFMGKAWDNLPPSPKYWRALLDIVYPGGYLFTFSGTRTAGLLDISCRIGGWEPFDRVASFGWVQGQGMAKGANISKKLDASEVAPCPDCQVELDSLSEQEIQDWADYEDIAFSDALADMVETRRRDCETCEGSGQVRGVEREVVGKMVQPGSTNLRTSMGNGWQESPDITAPATPPG